MSAFGSGWLQAQTPAAPPPLQLRDIHLPPEPSWWPPAPGWWLLALLLVVVLVLLLRWTQRRWRERARIGALRAQFDRAAVIDDPAARIAAISELLRRAARLTDAHAGQLQGGEWLRYLDGSDSTEFSNGAGRVLIDGAYRPKLDVQQAAALIAPARRRFLQLLADAP